MSDPTNGRRRATIRDVARRAGVGTMTVSRVVTGKGYVSNETRNRVEEAIVALGYLPNHQARGLRSQRSGIIALIASDITNPYFTTIARGIEDEARQAGSLLLIVSSDEDETQELRSMEHLVQRGIDGVVLVPSHQGTAAIEIARERGIPCVVVDRRGPPDFDCIRSDSAMGATGLADLLLGLGHRHCGVLAAEEGISTSDDRLQAFADRVHEAGGTVSVARGTFKIEDERPAVRRLLEAVPPPTCLFAVNNFLAIGAIRALAELKIRVPEDMSIVGFDDLPANMLAFPFLTVASQPAREVGTLAGRRLLARIADPTLSPEEIVLPTSILERGSVGAVRL